MLTWDEWERGTSFLYRLASALPEQMRSDQSWEKWLLYLWTDAKNFLTAPDRARARTLERTLYEWRKHQGASGLLRSRLTQPVQMSERAIILFRRLAADADQLINAKAITSLCEESPKVAAHFATDMPPAYSTALTATFVSAAPLRHPHMLLHETRLDFENHYNHHFSRPGMFPASGVKAFCTSVYAGYPHEAELTGRPLPMNRLIELPPDFVTDSVAHELLHWVTHEHYEDGSRAFQHFGNKVVIEGVTEYFSRVIYPSRTSYPDELAVVQGAIAQRRVSEASLRKAYFGGIDVASVLRELALAIAEADAASDAAAIAGQMGWWSGQLTRQKNKSSPEGLSPGLREFLQKLSDTQIDTLANGSGASPQLIQQIKQWVAKTRPAPRVP